MVLWLNGGPGCSSLTGLFMELGPSFIDKDRKARYNPYSWNSNASVIFLDQPVNVGFSYSDGSVSNTAAAGKDVYALLTLFFKQFPEYATQDFHIAGESYGGHYLPIFTAEILSHRKRNINLKSILIGNGLTDELVQYPYYRPMACGDGGWPAVLDEPQCRAMDHALPRCLGLIEGCYGSESVWSCVPAAIYCNNAIIGPYQRTGRNPYDVRRPCGDNPLCYEDLDWISDFLNRRDVQDALGVEVHSYDTCNFDINRNFLFQGDWMLPIQRAVPAILEEVPILVYAVSFGPISLLPSFLSSSPPPPPPPPTETKSLSTGRHRLHLQLARQPRLDRSVGMARQACLQRRTHQEPDSTLERVRQHRRQRRRQRRRQHQRRRRKSSRLGQVVGQPHVRAPLRRRSHDPARPARG